MDEIIAIIITIIRTIGFLKKIGNNDPIIIPIETMASLKIAICFHE